MIKVIEAIKTINPNAKYKITGSDIDTCEIEWIDTTPISKTDIKAQIPVVEFNMAMENLRGKRNKKLLDSDWEVIMTIEKGITLSESFKTYRQNLRDITEGVSTVEDVNNITWPTKP